MRNKKVFNQPAHNDPDLSRPTEVVVEQARFVLLNRASFFRGCRIGYFVGAVSTVVFYVGFRWLFSFA